MKTIQQILDNYDKYETFLEDRFGKRFCEYLTPEQLKTIGFYVTDNKKAENWLPKEWSEINVLMQLCDDAEFGEEKARDQRGISSNLMFSVCNAWLDVLDKEDLKQEDYDDYGLSFFLTVQSYCNDRLKELGV